MKERSQVEFFATSEWQRLVNRIVYEFDELYLKNHPMADSCPQKHHEFQGALLHFVKHYVNVNKGALVAAANKHQRLADFINAMGRRSTDHDNTEPNLGA